ncbi:MAG: leucine-rich repeat domain-containing protein [Candidatus Coproplasma sp.]
MDDFVIRLNENGEKVLVRCNVKEGTAIIPDGIVHIAKDAFIDKYLDKVIVPQSVKTIEEKAFCLSKFKAIELPDGLEEICEYAFNFCTRLKSVIIPHGVKHIGKGAFSFCYELKRVYIPKSVVRIDKNAFEACRELTIYCEETLQEGWLNEPEETYSYKEDITEGFNFHRSAGSFDDSYVVNREIVYTNSFNPDKRPIVTNVPLEQFLKLQEEDNL